MYKLLLSFLVLCGLCQFCWAQRLQTDARFAQGVDQYHQGKYQEAAAIFAEVDKADEIAGAPQRRRMYAPMWQAACFMQLGDTVKARELSPVFYKDYPIDRSKTIVLDSLLNSMTDERINGLRGNGLRTINKGIQADKDLFTIYKLSSNVAEETHPFHLYLVGQCALISTKKQLVNGPPSKATRAIMKTNIKILGPLVKSTMGLTMKYYNMTPDEMISSVRLIVEMFYLKEYLSAHSYHNLLWTDEDYLYYEKNVEYMVEIYQMDYIVNYISGLVDENTIDYTKAHRYVSQFYFYTGNTKELENSCGKALKAHCRFVTKAFSYLPTAERKKYWSQYEAWFQSIVPKYTYYYQTAKMSALTYDATLFSKGLLLNAENELQNAVLSSNDDEAKKIFEQLRTIQIQLVQQYELPLEKRTMNCEELEQRSEELEKELMARSAQFGKYTEKLSMRWKDVQKRLDKDDLAIEFLRFKVQNDSVIYVALTLKKGYKAPHFIMLSTAKEMENGANNSERQSQLVWQPLQDELKDVSRVYFAPAGIFYCDAIEYLPTLDGDLFCNRYQTFRLSSTRELAIDRPLQSSGSFALFGGIDYGNTIEVPSVIDNSKARMDPVSCSLRSLAFGRGAQNGIEYLEGTKIEIDSIAALIPNAHVYSGEAGTETALKELSASPLGTLHISTHGFAFSPNESDEEIIFAFLLPKTDRISAEEEAMSLTGLLFAGVNRYLLSDSLSQTSDDGILTAREISNLDFHNLDLVVLSACETGLGEITGDGVFGLQRGFKKAGAQSILMSLWKVDDEATCLLMTEFYKNWMGGATKHDALEMAKQTVRSHTEKGWNDPKYWAAFILLDALD